MELYIYQIHATLYFPQKNNKLFIKIINLGGILSLK